MPITGSAVEYGSNVKLAHVTKNNSPDEPVQLAFSVIDETGHEDIIPGVCPTAAALFQVVSENGWLGTTRTTRPIAMRKTG
jgi:hypothetical protein